MSTERSRNTIPCDRLTILFHLSTNYRWLHILESM